jgi:hypothetical protein
MDRTPINEVVKQILGRYTSDYQYFKSARLIDEKTVEGKFLVSGSAHVADRDMEHLAITETQMCLNQFFQVYMAYLVESGYFENVPPITFEDYWPNSDEFLFVVEQNIRFKKHIEPDEEFTGILVKTEERLSRRRYYHMVFEFDFHDGAHFGNIRLAFNPEGLIRALGDEYSVPSEDEIGSEIT